ncbi:MAG: tRNA uridine-5-carboxymethylaminomethyl(34) synthesis GTPase MnmE [Kiritimatiellia bacterium]
MKDISDTIAAISTAPGPGGIAVIRISGPASLAVADRIFKCAPPLPSRRKAPALVFGHVVSGKETLDEALLLIMRAPKSYTREDVIEIQCHGGTLCAQRVLRSVLDRNVRLADPGEFTRRAFINGRIDLVQAEAVIDIINAQTELSAKIAMEQLLGRLTHSLEDIYKILLDSTADLESALDFMDDELPDTFIPAKVKRLQKAKDKINALLATWNEGHILREGALVVISGKPNTGKSTLLNAILGKDRVIVSPVPGTTRDIIEEHVVIGGIPIRLTDTAGLRKSDCAIEQEGVRRARSQIGMADINIYVLDASVEIDEEDRSHITSLDPARSIIVFNKKDLGIKADASLIDKYKVISTYAIAREGIVEVTKAILNKLNLKKSAAHHSAVSERHRQILSESISSLDHSILLLKSNKDSMLILAAADLKNVLNGIASIIGKLYQEDVLDSIFSKFCIGK